MTNDRLKSTLFLRKGQRPSFLFCPPPQTRGFVDGEVVAFLSIFLLAYLRRCVKYSLVSGPYHSLALSPARVAGVTCLRRGRSCWQCAGRPYRGCPGVQVPGVPRCPRWKRALFRHQRGAAGRARAGVSRCDPAGPRRPQALAVETAGSSQCGVVGGTLALSCLVPDGPWVCAHLRHHVHPCSPACDLTPDGNSRCPPTSSVWTLRQRPVCRGPFQMTPTLACSGRRTALVSAQAGPRPRGTGAVPGRAPLSAYPAASRSLLSVASHRLGRGTATSG